jgi:uncharacterized membrane protein
MINSLKQNNRLHISVLLLLMTFFSFGLSVLRVYLSNSLSYIFLNWNLFLAFIPWAISTIVIVKKINNKFLLFILIISWLIFFPNSPYILTDFFHLNYRFHIPVWYDFIEILSFAWTGLIFGFVSLMDIEFLLGQYINKKIISVLLVVFLFLGSFGIYLGRFLRWNSWDIFTNPFCLISDISDRIINPLNHPRTWGLTILMGILLNLMFFSIKFFKRIEKPNKLD